LRPKLLYLVSEDWYFVSHRLALAVAARDAGYDVAVATRVRNEGATIENAGLRLIPIDFERARLAPLHEVRSLAALVSLYRREAPDLVHHVAVKPVIYGSIAARLAGVPSVVNALMGLGYVYNSPSRKARALRPLVSALLKAALSPNTARTIVQNKDDLALLRDLGLAPPDSLRLVAGSGVDAAAYTVVEPPEGPPIVLLPARLLRAKGIFEFAEAARRLREKGVVARFVLAGAPDPLNPGSVTDAEVAHLVKSGAVEAWGWRADMPSVLQQSSLVCLPSYYGEGVPKSLIEAAASGRAIVTTDMPGCREIVRTGQNGWLVPPRNVDALAQTIEDALSKPDLCRTYGLRGRQIVVEEYASELVIAATLKIYAEVRGR